jgi:hypothetical protein
MQRCLAVSYLPISTEYCSHFRRLMTHEAEMIRCAETSGANYQSTQGNIPENRRPQPD